MGERGGVKELIADLAPLRPGKWALGHPAPARTTGWAGALANPIGALNRLLWKAGVGEGGRRGPASILSKIPGKLCENCEEDGKDRID